jgi:division protein CdvB (Snf7/Vps24/ESCRT-III family)
MPVDWEIVARMLAAKVVETGKKTLEKAVEGGVDAVLADVEEGVNKAFKEVQSRVQRARSRVQHPSAAEPSTEEPRAIVVEAEIVDEVKKRK